MGAEFKKKGIHVIFGPVVGPQGRIVKGGRNWEGKSCSKCAVPFNVQADWYYRFQQ